MSKKNKKKTPPTKRLPKSPGQKNELPNCFPIDERTMKLSRRTAIYSMLRFRPYPESQKETKRKKHEKTKKGIPASENPWMLKRSKVSSKKKNQAEIEFLWLFPSKCLPKFGVYHFPVKSFDANCNKKILLKTILRGQAIYKLAYFCISSPLYCTLEGVG